MAAAGVPGTALGVVIRPRMSRYGVPVPADPLAVLSRLPDVPEAAEEARAAVDKLLWDRTVRRRGKALAAESAVVGAWANAAFDGAEVLLDSLRGGAVEDSAMGRVALRTLAMYAEIPTAAELVETAPLQALARMHSVLAIGSVAVEQLGRPRSGDGPDDPLRLGGAASPAELGPRLQGLAELLVVPTAAPAVVVAGVVHAELATLQPFAWGSGVVARAMTRVLLRARGLDPDNWSFPEAGLRMLGRPKYVAALRGYAGGEPQGVAQWLVVHSRMVAGGARAAAAEVDRLPDDG